MFYFERVILSPTAGVKTSHFLEELCGVLVPSSERLNNKRLERDSLCTAVIVMGLVLGCLSHIDCCSCVIGGAMKIDRQIDR